MCDAERDLLIALQAAIEAYGLTEGKVLRVVTSVFGGQIQDIAKYMIRVERHGDPTKPGGEA